MQEWDGEQRVLVQNDCTYSTVGNRLTNASSGVGGLNWGEEICRPGSGR